MSEFSEEELEKIATQARRAYKREWYKKNSKRVADYNKAYWLRKAKEIAEQQEKKEEE